MFYLFFRAIQQIPLSRPVAALNTLCNTLVQKAVHCLSVRHGIPRKLVAKIVQFKLQERGKVDSILDSSWNIVKECSHFLRRPQMTLAVECQQTSCLVELNMMTDRSKHVLNLAIIGGRISYAVCCKHRQSQRACNANCSLVSPLFLSLLMSLQFDVNTLTPEDAYQPFHGLAPRGFTASSQCCCQRAFIASGQTD